MASSVADAMVALLKSSGVRRVYGVPGDSLNGFTDALRRDGGVTWEHVRHEEAAAFAAAAEAALTGELAVCAGSCGPGNLHLINGLYDANRSRVPVLAIAAHIPEVEIGLQYFQETHPQDVFRECSVYCELASIPEQMPHIMESAMRAALERGGVAVVVIPAGCSSPTPRPAGDPGAQGGLGAPRASASITPAAAARRISTESSARPCRKSTMSKSLASVSAKRTKARASTASRVTSPVRSPGAESPGQTGRPAPVSLIEPHPASHHVLANVIDRAPARECGGAQPGQRVGHGVIQLRGDHPGAHPHRPRCGAR